MSDGVAPRGVGFGFFVRVAASAGENEFFDLAGAVQIDGVFDAFLENGRKPLALHRRPEHDRRVRRLVFLRFVVEINLGGDENKK